MPRLVVPLLVASLAPLSAGPAGAQAAPVYPSREAPLEEARAALERLLDRPDVAGAMEDVPGRALADYDR